MVSILKCMSLAKAELAAGLIGMKSFGEEIECELPWGRWGRRVAKRRGKKTRKAREWTFSCLLWHRCRWIGQKKKTNKKKLEMVERPLRSWISALGAGLVFVLFANRGCRASYQGGFAMHGWKVEPLIISQTWLCLRAPPPLPPIPTRSSLKIDLLLKKFSPQYSGPIPRNFDLVGLGRDPEIHRLHSDEVGLRIC